MTIAGFTLDGEGIIVQRHPRIGDEIERGAVGEIDTARRIGAGLDDVALVDGVADIQRDRDAIANDDDVADDFLDLADRIGWRRRRLRELARRRRAGEKIDEGGRKAGAVGSDQRRMFFAGEIIGDNVAAAVVAGEDEVGPVPLEVAGKQQRGIGNDDGVGVRGAKMKDGTTCPVAAFGGRVGHSTLPATPSSVYDHQPLRTGLRAAGPHADERLKHAINQGLRQE
ncbi:MAG: hypothetical protein KGQ47_07600 [Hyphomicrobiales bacterium]|nr:hypothetical protein [Hyphomicrobiales bacterium]